MERLIPKKRENEPPLPSPANLHHLHEILARNILKLCYCSFTGEIAVLITFLEEILWRCDGKTVTLLSAFPLTAPRPHKPNN